MDISEIRKLIRLVQQSDVTEIEVTEGESTVRISRQATATATTTAAPVQPVTVAAPAATPVPPSTAPSAEVTTPETAEDNEEHVVKSPMVGTFYAAASPDDEPFVTEGSTVKKGDVLCIIEAMKLMNEIEAEYDGVVKKILVKNAQPLEYGQPIFVITPA